MVWSVKSFDLSCAYVLRKAEDSVTTLVHKIENDKCRILQLNPVWEAVRHPNSTLGHNPGAPCTWIYHPSLSFPVCGIRMADTPSQVPKSGVGLWGLGNS